MAAPKNYPGELRERATRMVIDARRNLATWAGAIARVADQPRTARQAAGTK